MKVLWRWFKVFLLALGIVGLGLHTLLVFIVVWEGISPNIYNSAQFENERNVADFCKTFEVQNANSSKNGLPENAQQLVIHSSDGIKFSLYALSDIREDVANKILSSKNFTSSADRLKDFSKDILTLLIELGGEKLPFSLEEMQSEKFLFHLKQLEVKDGKFSQFYLYIYSRDTNTVYFVVYNETKYKTL